VTATRNAAAISADDIAGCLARSTFKNELVVVDRCLYLGDECDLLVVDRSLYAVDVEVKVSRADLKADRRKSKWNNFPAYTQIDGKWTQPAPVPREWPRSVWKHYYAMPAALWKPDLIEFCGLTSGVLLVHPRAGLKPARWRTECVRRAKPNRQAKKLTAEDAIAIARLASLRMWDAYAQLRWSSTE
jgi:hypothetical protein